MRGCQVIVANMRLRRGYPRHRHGGTLDGHVTLLLASPLPWRIGASSPARTDVIPLRGVDSLGD